MNEKITPHELIPQPENREQAEFFEPIDQNRLEELAEEFSQECGIDLTQFSIKVSKPGEASFDTLEILTKMQEKYGPKKVADRLRGYGVDLSKRFDHTDENAKKMMEIGRQEGLEIDGVLKGLVYNTNGNITYTAIREDQAENLAAIYSKKEGEEKKFVDMEEAKNYLRNLAEKYLYHELGHSVFRKIITEPADRQAWFEAVGSSPELAKELFELQKDKYPNSQLPDIMPIIIDEAFAEIFSSAATKGKITSRVSSYPEIEETLKNLLKKYGFKL